MSTLLILINYLTIKTTSSIRAYVNGESRYTKGQKDGSGHLILYIHTGDPYFLNLFREEFKVPLGDSIARVELMNGQDIKIIRDGFLQGENHVDDIDDMIWLFQNFKNVSFMKRAIEIWKNADVEIGNLIKLGETTQQIMTTPGTTEEQKELLILEVEKLTLKLTELEQEFSDVLGEAARKINGYLFFSNLILTLVLIGSAGSFASSMIRRLSRSNKQFRETLHFGKMGSCELGLSTLQLHISKELFELLEVKESEPRNIPLEEFLTTYVQPDFYQAIREAIKMGKSDLEKVVNLEFEMITTTGGKIWIECKAIFKGNKAMCILHDITEKRDAAKKIINAKDLSDSIINGLPGTFFLFDENLKYLRWNKNFETVTGYSGEEISQMTPFDFFADDSKELVTERMRSVFTSGQADTEIDLVTKDKVRIPYYFTGWLISYEGKNCIVGIGMDISKSKQQERNIVTMNRSLTDFQNAIQNSSIVSRADKAGIITYVNENFEQISGYKKEELIGQNHRIINSLYHPKAFWLEMWKTIASGKIWRAEVKNKSKGGSFYWVDTFIMPFLDEQGRVKEFLSIRNDITQRKSQKENIIALNQSLADFQNAIQSSSIVSRADKSGIITYVNENFEVISGYKKEELIGQNHRIVNSGYHPKSFWTDMWKTIASGKIWRAEVKNKGKDGSFYWVDTFVMPFLDEEGRVREFLSIRNDITSRKQSEEALSNSREKAEMANRAKSEFLANMSHEIRTPLNGVIGFTDLLMETNLDVIQNQYMATIRQSAYGLLDIVNNVLDFSKIEAGKMELVRETTDLYTLCSQVIEILSIQARQKQINLLFSYDAKLPRMVQADPIRLKQVLVNLLGNAIKFTDTGEIELKIEPTESNDILLEVHKNMFAFRFSVRDTGVGIHPENQEKIFHAFSQEDSSVTKKYGGTGLGLTISNTLLNLMDSRLNLKSEHGRGSVFYFDVMFEAKEADTTMAIKASKRLSAEYAEVETVSEEPFVLEKGNFKVLIAEDNFVNMALAKILIGNIIPNATLIEVVNGKLAVEAYINEQPDMVFMDIQMPIMNGYEATVEIRKLEKASKELGAVRVPIIALTAGAIQGEKEKCIEIGMNDFVTKPILSDNLLAVIKRWVHKQQPKT